MYPFISVYPIHLWLITSSEYLNTIIKFRNHKKSIFILDSFYQFSSHLSVVKTLPEYLKSIVKFSNHRKSIFIPDSFISVHPIHQWFIFDLYPISSVVKLISSLKNP